jgi:hypothetical protein
MFHQIPNDEAVTAALIKAQVPTGTYFMPWPRDTPETFERFVAQHKSGPFYRLDYVREGVDPEALVKFVKGTVQTFFTALCGVIVAFLAGTATRLKRFYVVFVAGLVGSLYITVAEPVWFHMPWDYVRGVLCYQLVSWTLMAAVCAWFIRSMPRGT